MSRRAYSKDNIGQKIVELAEWLRLHVGVDGSSLKRPKACFGQREGKGSV
jgi:hypothetical protein